jgi:hypothetical protein
MPASTVTVGIAASTTAFTSATSTARRFATLPPPTEAAAGEREHRVRRAAGNLHTARGAFGVAREPNDAARRCGAPADDHRVDGGGDLGGRGVGDVGEVGGREQHRLLEAVVDAQEQLHAVGERVRTRAARRHRGRRAVEHGVGIGRTVHCEANEVSVVQHEGPGRGAEQDARRGTTARDEEARCAHGGGGRCVGDVRVVRGADHPELRPAVLEEAHCSEREIRVGREAAELGLEVVERRAEHGFADGAALGDADRARDGGGSRGDAANLRLLLDDDDLGRQELSAHDAPRLFFFAFTSGRLTSASEVV